MAREGSLTVPTANPAAILVVSAEPRAGTALADATFMLHACRSGGPWVARHRRYHQGHALGVQQVRSRQGHA
jgi:hypothetical protein